MSNTDYLQWENLVYKLALQYFGSFKDYGYSIEDLVQVGSLGLVKSFNSFDENKDASRATFFYKCIAYELSKELQSLKRDKRKANFNNMSTLLPSKKDGDESSARIQDLLPDKTDIVAEVEAEIIKNEILDDIKSILSKKEYNVFYLRTFEDKTYDEIGAIYKFTGEHIRQIYKIAKAKIYDGSEYVQELLLNSRINKLNSIASSSNMYKLTPEKYVFDKLIIENKLKKQIFGGGHKLC